MDYEAHNIIEGEDEVTGDVYVIEASLFLAGMVNALRNRNDLRDIRLCVKADATAADDISVIKKELEALDIQNIINAVRKMKDLAAPLQRAFTACSDLDYI